MTGPRRIRIPYLVDIAFLDDAHDILEAGRSPGFDRDFRGSGPIINRLLVSRVSRTLRINDKLLPSIAPRQEPGRAEAKEQLQRRLDEQPAAFDTSCLEQLARYVAAGGDRTEMARTAQQLVGRVFVPDFSATPSTWQAAVTLDKAIRSNNPAWRLAQRLTGHIARAKSLLAASMHNDGAAVHAIAIAIHNVVRSIENLRQHAHTVSGRTDEEIVSLCLAAPERVLRQDHSGATAGHGKPLTVLELEKCRARTLRRDIAFMTGTWSACPAGRWVPALLLAILSHARSIGVTRGSGA